MKRDNETHALQSLLERLGSADGSISERSGVVGEVLLRGSLFLIALLLLEGLL
jgi:hypothetical protein